jgi:hypothetical protein
MSEHPLTTYLHDHLAGATGGVELLEALRDHQAGTPLAAFADSLLAEIQNDRAVLESLAERLGGGGNMLKEAAAWVGQKASHLKLGHLAKSKLGTFEALEALGLGILGKRALWRALEVLGPDEPRLASVDFGALARRAEAQYQAVEERRLAAAKDLLQPVG